MGRIRRFSSRFLVSTPVRTEELPEDYSKRLQAPPGSLKDGSAVVLNTFERAGRKAGFLSARRIRNDVGLIISPFGATIIIFLYFLLVPMNYTRVILTTRPIRSSTPCYEEEPTVCDLTPPLKYYIWNLTNVEQVMCAPEPPLLAEL
jgi:hypothetical protein